jgi:hypothetical protein
MAFLVSKLTQADIRCKYVFPAVPGLVAMRVRVTSYLSHCTDRRELETETLQVAGPPYESLCCQMVRLVPSNLLQY